MIKRLITMTAIAAAIAAPATAQAAVTHQRASFTDIENDVMCVACREPLAVSQAPQALAERSYIKRLIAQGETKAQIERALVAQYGPSVLGKPPAHGFNLTVYILPPAIVVLGLVTLAFTLPRWRRRARAATSAELATPTPSLDQADARRLDEDLARFT